MNLIYIEGNLVKEPEVIYTEKGTAITKALIAESNADGTPHYINLVMFGESAERFGNDFIVGRQYKAEGRLIMNDYVNKLGKKVRRYDIYVRHVQGGYIPKKYKV